MLLRSRWLVWLALPSFFVSALQSQTSPTDSIGTTLKSKSRLVVVDVVVTDHNDDPVAGLHKEDFQVLEDGKPQAISVFEEHTGDPPSPAKTPALPPHTYSNLPPADVPDTLNVLLLDGLNTALQDQSSVHRKMVEYLAGIRPGTRLAIFTMGLQLRLVQGFTGDTSLLLAALKDEKSGSGPKASPLLRSAAEVNSDNQIIGEMQSLLAVDPGIQASIDALRQFQIETSLNQTDARVGTTLHELQQLARYLGGFPGRKNVIWFSGSFPLNIFQETSLQDTSEFDKDAVARQYEESVRRTADQLTKAQVAVYPVEAGGLLYTLYDVGSLPTNMQANAKQALNDQVTDIQNDSVQRNANHAAMDELAKDTGGEAFYNTNGIGDAVSRAMHNGARYYTLDYSPVNKDMNGRYRHIQVKLAHGRYKMAYRRGYNAIDDTVRTTDQNLSADPLQPLMAPGMPNFAQIVYLMSVLPVNPQPDAKVTRAGDNLKFDGPFTRVGVDFAIHEKDLKLDATPDGVHHGSLEFTLIAYDHYGKPLNWMVRSTDFTLSPERYAAYLKVGLQLHFDIDAPRSTAYLRTGVYDLASGKSGTLEVPLSAAMVTPAAATTSSASPAAAKPN